MLKQGVVQETLADINMPAALPPLNNLPQWSRINTLDKARYPKPFLKDRLQPLPNPPADDRRKDSADSDDHDLGIVDNMNPSQKIHHLEKSIIFLQQQHQEVLGNLHDEIDGLKRNNKELQFQIVMIQQNPQTPLASGSVKKRDRRAVRSGQPHRDNGGAYAPHPPGMRHPVPPAVPRPFAQSQVSASDQQSDEQDDKFEELKIIFLEEEIKELNKGLKEEKARNHYLTQLLDQAEKHKHTQRQSETTEEKKPSSASSSQSTTQPELSPAAIEPMPFNATLEPLIVHLPDQAPRPPTLKECEVIVRYLQQTSDRQNHELNQLKSDLRDVLYSHKWTPDAFLLAKAYIAQDDAREVAADPNKLLPKIPYKQPSRKLPDLAYVRQDMVSLPALKQTMGNKAVERKKRTQILQKARIKKEVL